MEEQQPQQKPKYRGKSKPDGTFTLVYEDSYHKFTFTLASERLVTWMISWLQMVSPEMRRKALERIHREVN